MVTNPIMGKQKCTAHSCANVLEWRIENREFIWNCLALVANVVIEGDHRHRDESE